MTTDNFREAIETYMNRRPFHPFVIELIGGARHEIDHPRVAGFRGDAFVFFSPGATTIWFDHESVVSVVDAASSELRSNNS
jgi:hypothetical protein